MTETLYRSPRRFRTMAGRADVVTWLTLYVLVLFAVPSRLVFQPLGSAGAPSMVMGLSSFAIWAAIMLFGRGTVARRAAPLHWALGAFAFSVGISYVLAMSRPLMSDEVSPSDVAIISLVSWIGTQLIAQDGIRSRRRLDVLVWRLAIAGGLLAALGLAQFALRMPLIDLISIPGLTAAGDAPLYVRNGIVRPSGTAIHPIEYGAILTILLPLAFHVGVRRTEVNPVLRWLPSLAILAAIALSSSRSAYLGALVATLICSVAWSGRVRLRMLGLLAGGAVALAIVSPRVVTSVIALFAGVAGDPSIASRTDSFGVAWLYLADHPFFGRGLGTFLPKYRIFDNEYLLLLVSVGIVGTVAMLAIAITAVVQLANVHRNALEERSADLAVSLVAAIVAGYVSLAFFDAFAFPMTMGILFLVVGIAGAFTRLESDRRARPVSAFA